MKSRQNGRNQNAGWPRLTMPDGEARIRLAYIMEYNLELGKVKLEQLPEIDPKLHKGWRLLASEKMLSPKDVRDMGEEGKTALSEIVKEHANTPWAVLAEKTQRSMVIGLKWQPAFNDD